MAAAQTAPHTRPVDRTVAQASYPPADLVPRLAKEIVVDWQMPADVERNN